MNAQALVLTDNAANKVRQLRDSEGNQDLMLRVYVTGGGCSGFSYGFNFAESQNEDPQPQVVVAFGFCTTKREPSRPSK